MTALLTRIRFLSGVGQHHCGVERPGPGVPGPIPQREAHSCLCSNCLPSVCTAASQRSSLGSFRTGPKTASGPGADPALSGAHGRLLDTASFRDKRPWPLPSRGMHPRQAQSGPGSQPDAVLGPEPPTPGPVRRCPDTEMRMPGPQMPHPALRPRPWSCVCFPQPPSAGCGSAPGARPAHTRRPATSR